MILNNTQLINYKDRIKFSDEDKVKYQSQIDNLVSSIQTKIPEIIDTRVYKVLQSGSWRKGTILKPKGDVPVDIDLVFFLDIEPSEQEQLHQANDMMLPILQSIYPQKSSDDFWNNPKTAGLEFIDSGLNVDIVPVGKTRDPDYVAQPDKNFEIYFTSPKKQLQFISDRKKANQNFATIVRILKKWRNNHSVNLSSFILELIVAYQDINFGVETNISESILRFYKFVAKKQFPVLLFNAPYGEYRHDGSHIYIADPTYDTNNVARTISDTQWKLIRIQADAAFDTLVLADHEEYESTTFDLWKEVFGADFNIYPIKS